MLCRRMIVLAIAGLVVPATQGLSQSAQQSALLPDRLRASAQSAVNATTGLGEGAASRALPNDSPTVPQAALAPDFPGLLESPTSRRFRVEPGGYLLEHSGSGIFGPFQYDESARWLDFGIIVQTEYLNNSPNDGPYSQYLFFRRLRPVTMGGFGDSQAVIMLDFGAGQNGDSSARRSAGPTLSTRDFIKPMPASAVSSLGSPRKCLRSAPTCCTSNAAPSAIPTTATPIT